MTHAERELAVDHACREAGLSVTETEALHYLLVEGWSPAQIHFKLRRDTRLRGATFREMLIQAVYAAAPHLPEFWRPSRDFPRHLLECVENRCHVDDRPPGVCGVASAKESQRFQGAPLIAADDARLRQDVVSAARLWSHSQVSAASAA